MRLLQIPFSHNCIKVRRVLEWKLLAYETEDIHPMNRERVHDLSGQGLVPVLVDGDRTIWDSTAILLHLEERHPDPPLLPADPRLQAECLVLEDWADTAFMALTRRLAYGRTLRTPGALEDLFLPRVGGLRRRMLGAFARRAVRRRFRLSPGQHRRDLGEVRRVARLALDRLAGQDHLVGDQMSLADITLAAMSAPLWAADPEVCEDPWVRRLLVWGRRVLGEELVSYYLRGDVPSGRPKALI